MMHIRAARYTRDGLVDVEYNHPTLGWIFITTSPEDPHTSNIYYSALKMSPSQYVEAESSYLEDSVPEYISRFQLRAQLHINGLLIKADEVVSKADALIQIAWKDAAVFFRGSTSIEYISEKLGLSGREVDDIFHSASKITA